MADRKQLEIKDRILKRAMELWGVSHARDMDPVVDLLLDVVAYESNRLHHELLHSDAQMLLRLASLLIDSKWALPRPAHALLSVTPNRGECCELEIEDHFYAEKHILGGSDLQIFLTPLFPHRLVDARIQCIAGHTSLRQAANRFTEPVPFLRPEERIDDHTLWVGLDLSDEVLQQLHTLTLCIKPADSGLLGCMKLLACCDARGYALETRCGIPEQEPSRDNHYFDEIRAFYDDLYFDIVLTDDARTKRTCREQFPRALPEAELPDGQTALCWIGLRFPALFTRQELEQTEVWLNTFPVVNRRLVYKQHNFRTGGRIIPLTNRPNSRFLNIHRLQDDRGRRYCNRLHQYDEHPAGVFSLYFGELERFDAESAGSLIAKVLQRIREDGNAFASLNPDTLTGQLKELLARVDTLEKGLASAQQEQGLIPAFLLAVPHAEAAHAEIKYWVTAGAAANGFDERTPVQQYNMEKFDASGIVLRTPLQGGSAHDSEQELIDSLRYGLIARERIVSKEDIRRYLLHKIGKYVRRIDIGNGVAVSCEPKQGLIRVTEIRIALADGYEAAAAEREMLARYLEKDLAERSIGNSTYKITFL